MSGIAVSWIWLDQVFSVDGVYVADTANSRIQKFATDGTFLVKWGTVGDGQGQFKAPKGIAVGRSTIFMTGQASLSSAVFVADVNNSRIQKFDLFGSFVSEWSQLGFSPTYLGYTDQILSPGTPPANDPSVALGVIDQSALSDPCLGLDTQQSDSWSLNMPSVSSPLPPAGIDGPLDQWGGITSLQTSNTFR